MPTKQQQTARGEQLGGEVAMPKSIIWESDGKDIATVACESTLVNYDWRKLIN